MNVIHSITGIYTPVEVATKGDKYSCMRCNEDIIVREGAERVKHYAHVRESSCVQQASRDAPGGGGESIEHSNAKYMIKNIIDTKRPLVVIRKCKQYGCSEKEEFCIPTRDSVETATEYKIDRGVCDVFMRTLTGSYIFEILDSHRTHTRPEPWFEIRASDVQDNYNVESNIFKCQRFWKCEGCQKKQAEQAKRYEENRKIAYEKARMELYTFRFGKYDGQTYKYVLDVDPLYYKWALNIYPATITLRRAQQEMKEYLKEYLTHTARSTNTV